MSYLDMLCVCVWEAMRVCWYVAGRTGMVQSYTHSDQFALTHRHTQHKHTFKGDQLAFLGNPISPTAALKVERHGMLCRESENKFYMHDVLFFYLLVKPIWLFVSYVGLRIRPVTVIQLSNIVRYISWPQSILITSILPMCLHKNVFKVFANIMPK